MGYKVLYNELGQEKPIELSLDEAMDAAHKLYLVHQEKRPDITMDLLQQLEEFIIVNWAWIEKMGDDL